MGVNVLGAVAARSTDDGLTWTPYGSPDIVPNLTPVDLVLLPPSSEVPLGRIIAAGFGGIATSDDDGLSWAPSTSFPGGGLAFQAWAAIRVSPGARDGGHGGEVLAVVEGTSSACIYRSPDGLTWERASDFPAWSPVESRLLAAPDGAVYLYDTRSPGGSYHEGKPVWRSTDGGETWQSMGVIWNQWSTVPTEIVVGPDGHLWASTTGRSGDPAGLLGGVFRTVDPVYVVADDATPSPAPNVSISVRPNPAGASVSIALVAPEPGAASVSVYDTQGREVARVFSGAVAAGERSFDIDMSGWAAGVYVVRADVAGRVASARLVVGR